MSEERFSVDLTMRHRFPLDMSLNGFCQSLAKDFPKGKAPTRKLIRSALNALAFDGVPAYDSKDTLYTRVLRNSFAEENSEGDHNTYPHSIFWETYDFFKVICKARATSRTLRDQSLATESLKIFLQQLKELPTDQLASKYVNFQLLRDSRVRAELIEDLSPEIQKRLDTIYWLTFVQPEKVALKTIPTAFEQLDSLIIELMQEEICEYAREETCPLSILCDYYDRLVSIRAADNPAEQNGKIFTFVLEDNNDLMSSLKNVFRISQKETVSKKGEIDKQTLEILFEQYLQTRVETNCPKDAASVREFSHGYSELKEYILMEGKWETIEIAIRNELYRYLKNMFTDISKSDIVASDYSDYSDYKADSAESAYIKTLCKHTHNQIRSKLHLALRLLQKQNHYYQLVNTLLEDPDNTFRENVLKTLKGPLENWNELASLTRETLSKETPSAPFIMPENISAITELYNERLSSLTGDRLSEDVLKSIFQEIFESDSWSRCNALAYLLRLDCQLIGYTLADEAISEIKDMHQILQTHYRRYRG